MPKPTSTNSYLASLPVEQCAALEKVRKQILSAAPRAEDHFGYGLPGFSLDGHPLIYFGASKNHCALYGIVPSGFAKQLAGFKQSKGAIQFAPDKPIPAATLKAIVKARIAENRMRWAEKSPKRAASRAKKK